MRSRSAAKSRFTNAVGTQPVAEGKCLSKPRADGQEPDNEADIAGRVGIFKDRYQDSLLEVIKAKIEGLEPSFAVEEERVQVLTLFVKPFCCEPATGARQSSRSILAYTYKQANALPTRRPMFFLPAGFVGLFIYLGFVYGINGLFALLYLGAVNKFGKLSNCASGRSGEL